MTDHALLTELATVRSTLRERLAGRIIGQSDTIDQVLTAVLAGGHALLIGVPGLAKTMLVKSLAEALGWSFRRIQFTPDLMPADITGTEILVDDKATGTRTLRFAPGPIFGQLILADEINRTPPKTQAALLEAMQEGSVTAAGTTHALPKPFCVLATQNPIEQEGTYPLPEAQLDRFLLSIRLEYPSASEELAIALLDPRLAAPIQAVTSSERFAALAGLVARLPVPEVAVRHAVALARASRPAAGEGPAWVAEQVAWGAGPRASQALIAAARARAALLGQPAVGVADVRAVAPSVLAHRLVPTFAAAGAGVDGRAIAQRLLESVAP